MTIEMQEIKSDDTLNEKKIKDIIAQVAKDSQNKKGMTPETIEFLGKVKENKIPNIKIFRVDTMPTKSRYVILSDNNHDITALDKSGLISQLGHYFNILSSGSGVFNPNPNSIDSFIDSITNLTHNIYEDVGLIVNQDDFKTRYNYYTISKTERELLEKVKGIKKRDLKEVYNERVHLFPHVDFLIKNMLDVNNYENKPKNESQTGDLLLFFLNHLNFSLQYKEKSTKMFYIISAQGTGKGLFSEILKKFFGHLFETVRTDIFTGTGFNAQVQGKRFILFEEVATNKKDLKEISGRFKSMVTEKHDRLRVMYKDTVTDVQIFNMLAFSNLQGQLLIEPNCRRTNIIYGNKKLDTEVIRHFGYDGLDDFQNFIEAYRSEFDVFLETLLLSKVDITKAKNVTINNEAKSSEIKKTNDKKDFIRDIIKNADIEELDDYFYAYKDDETYKLMKAQILNGFLDNTSSSFLFKILCEYNYDNEQDFKQNDYLDRVIGNRRTVKYKTILGSESSAQIRQLPNYNLKDFQYYMKMQQRFKNDDAGVAILTIDDFISSVTNKQDLDTDAAFDRIYNEQAVSDDEVLQANIMEKAKKELEDEFNRKLKEMEERIRKEYEEKLKINTQCAEALNLLEGK